MNETKPMTIEEVTEWKTHHEERTSAFKIIYKALNDIRESIDENLKSPVARDPEYYSTMFSAITHELNDMKSRVWDLIKDTNGFVDYAIMGTEFMNFSIYVKVLHMTSLLMPEEEFLYRGLWSQCTFEDPKEPETETAKWQSDMNAILKKWNYLNAAYALSHGYPERLFYPMEIVYEPMLQCADEAYEKLDTLPETEDNLPLYTWAISIIKKLDANNTKLCLASLNDEMYKHDSVDASAKITNNPGEEYTYHVISF